MGISPSTAFRGVVLEICQSNFHVLRCLDKKSFATHQEKLTIDSGNGKSVDSSERIARYSPNTCTFSGSDVFFPSTIPASCCVYILWYSKDICAYHVVFLVA